MIEYSFFSDVVDYLMALGAWPPIASITCDRSSFQRIPSLFLYLRQANRLPGLSSGGSKGHGKLHISLNQKVTLQKIVNMIKLHSPH